MNQWAFVIAAYGITIAATLLIIGISWTAMARAEREAEAAKRR